MVQLQLQAVLKKQVMAGVFYIDVNKTYGTYSTRLLPSVFHWKLLCQEECTLQHKAPGTVYHTVS